MVFEQYKVACLCTSHLSKLDISALHSMAQDVNNNMVLERDTGFFIKLYTDGIGLNNMYSQSLKFIIQVLLKQGFTMIEFDCDASEHDIFNIYEH